MAISLIAMTDQGHLDGEQLVGITSEGGIAIRLLNKTGSPSVKGTLVKATSGTDLAFTLAGATEYMPFGVVYEAGIADGQLCWVVVYGMADVLIEDSTAATRGNWVKTSDTQAGRANATSAIPPGGGIVQQDEHAREIGHCIQTAGAGTNVLARCVLHFN